jgi:hypothetical protein
LSTAAVVTTSRSMDDSARAPRLVKIVVIREHYIARTDRRVEAADAQIQRRSRRMTSGLLHHRSCTWRGAGSPTARSATCAIVGVRQSDHAGRSGKGLILPQWDLPDRRRTSSGHGVTYIAPP